MARIFKPKSPADVASLARSHTATAIKTLAGIMNHPRADLSARIAACRELLIPILKLSDRLLPNRVQRWT
jgi:hypothetical protein